MSYQRGTQCQYKITTAWCSENEETPWLLESYDEIAFDNWNGAPAFFTDAVNKARSAHSEVRIIEVWIDYDKVEAAFETRILTGVAIEEKP